MDDELDKFRLDDGSPLNPDEIKRLMLLIKQDRAATRLDEATKAMEVAFNHRMDSGLQVALILAERVKDLTPTNSEAKP